MDPFANSATQNEMFSRRYVDINQPARTGFIPNQIDFQRPEVRQEGFINQQETRRDDHRGEIVINNFNDRQRGNFRPAFERPALEPAFEGRNFESRAFEPAFEGRTFERPAFEPAFEGRNFESRAFEPAFQGFESRAFEDPCRCQKPCRGPCQQPNPRGRIGLQIMRDISIFEREVAQCGKRRVVLQVSRGTPVLSSPITTTEFSILSTVSLNLVPGVGTVMGLGVLPSKNIIGGNVGIGNFTLDLASLGITPVIDNTNLAVEITVVGSVDGNQRMVELGLLAPIGEREFFYTFRPNTFTFYTI